MPNSPPTTTPPPTATAATFRHHRLRSAVIGRPSALVVMPVLFCGAGRAPALGRGRVGSGRARASARTTTRDSAGSVFFKHREAVHRFAAELGPFFDRRAVLHLIGVFSAVLVVVAEDTG